MKVRLAGAAVDKQHGRGHLCMLIVLFVAFVRIAQAEEPAPEQHAATSPSQAAQSQRPPMMPKICVLYEQVREDYNRFRCPPNWALYAVERPSDSEFASAESLPTRGTCCPLPAPDILLEKHILATPACPDGFVATGGQGDTTRKAPKEIRCTQINQTRYQLGSPQSGVYWGTSSTYYQQRIRYLREDLPVAIRHGVGRASFDRWTNVGCIGYPFGSLLVKKSGKQCHQVFFSELQFRGLPGDPPQGTPVPMYPQCDEISDLYDPDTKCLKFPTGR